MRPQVIQKNQYEQYKQIVGNDIQGLSVSTNTMNFINHCVNQINQFGALIVSEQDATKNFLCDFSPFVIQTILENRVDYTIAPHYSKILKAFLNLLGSRFFQLPEPFINVAGDILKQNKPFYQNESQQYFMDCCREFGNTNFLSIFADYLSKTSYSNFRIISMAFSFAFNLILFFPKETAITFAQSATQSIASIWETIPGDKIRDINEKDLGTIYCQLFYIVSNFNQEQITFISISYIKVLMKFARGGILEKQISSLQMICEALNQNQNNKNVTDFIVSEKLLQSVLPDLHQELLPSISFIIRFLIQRDSLEQDALSNFWNISITQHSSSIKKFFEEWQKIILEMSEKYLEKFVEVVSQTKFFPEPALEFLINIKTSQTSQNLFDCTPIFNCLTKVYTEEENTRLGCNSNSVSEKIALMTPAEYQTHSQLMLKAIEHYLPHGNSELVQAYQEKALETVKTPGPRVGYAMTILKALINNTSFVFSQYFNIVISVIRNNKDKASNYFDFLISILEKNQKVSDEQFESLKDIVIELDSDSICALLEKFFDVNSRNHSLQPKEHVLSEQQFTILFSILCEKSKFNDRIKKLYLKVRNIPSIKQVLWNTLRKGQDQNLISFLVSESGQNMNEFIYYCFQDIKNQGSIKVLIDFIKLNEEGLDRMYLRIPENKFTPDEDFIKIMFTGDYQGQIEIPNTMSFNGIIQRVAFIKETSFRNIVFYPLDDTQPLSSDTIVSDGMVIRVGIKNPSLKIPRNIDTSALPTLIIANTPEYYQSLYSIMISDEDPNMSLLALEIMNRLPSLPQEVQLEKQAAAEGKWESYLSIDQPQLLLYRVNLLGNLLRTALQREEYGVVFSFIQMNNHPSGISTLLNISLISRSVFKSKVAINLLLSVVRLILGIDFSKFQMNQINLTALIQNLFQDSTINDIVSWCHDTLSTIEELKNKGSRKPLLNENLKLLHNLLSILLPFIELNPQVLDNSTETPLYNLIKSTIFSDNQKIRSDCQSILQCLNVSDQIFQKYIFDLLPLASNSYSTNYFILANLLAQSIQPQNILLFQQLWKAITTALFENYRIPSGDDCDILSVLTFKPPSNIYANGLITILDTLFSKPDLDIKICDNSIELFDFLCVNFIFPKLKFYMPTNEMIHLLQLLAEKNNLNKKLSEYIRKLQENVLVVSTQNDDSELKFNDDSEFRGIKNLGATCYINATLQQLYNLLPFQESILTHDFSDDWQEQLQYLFAKLAFYPTKYITANSFIEKWKGWDGVPVNPHEQQDANEFLSMLLDRLESVIPEVTKLFKGTIVHNAQSLDKEHAFQNSTLESFISLPLEIKDHTCIEESLRTLAMSERVSGYETGQGKIDVEMFHRIRHAPSILIIQLKRFEFNVSSQSRIKLNSIYNISEELDLSSLMETPNQNVIYDLCGVEMHMGNSDSGHYFSYVHVQGSPYWSKFNDTEVSNISFIDVLEQSAGGYQTFFGETSLRNTNAYLLFYKLRTAETKSSQSIPSLSDISPSSSSEGFSSMTSNYNSFNSPLVRNTQTKQIIRPNKKALDRLVSDLTFFIEKARMGDKNIMKLIESLPDSENGFSTYSTMIQSLNSSYVPKNSQKCIEYSKSLEFAKLIISKPELFLQYVLQSPNPDVRAFYGLIASNSIQVLFAIKTEEYSNLCTTFISSACDILYSNQNLLIEQYESFTEYFNAITTFPQNIPEIYLNFITNTLITYNQHYPHEKILINIDLTPIFNMFRNMIQPNSTISQENKNDIIDSVLNTTNISLWIKSSKHYSAFIGFLSDVLNVSAETPFYKNFIIRKDISPEIYTTIFFAALFSKINIEYLVRVHKHLHYSPIQYLINFIQKYPFSISGQFMANNHASQFLDYYLLAASKGFRTSMITLSRTVFSRPIQDTQAPDYQNIISYINLILSHAYSDVVLKQLRDQFSMFGLSMEPPKSLDTLIFPDYLLLIETMVKQANNKEANGIASKLVSKFLSDSLKICLDNNIYSFVKVILNFIDNVCDSSLFTSFRVSLYTDCLYKCSPLLEKNPDFAQRLIFKIPDNKLSDLVKSAFFTEFVAKTHTDLPIKLLSKFDKSTLPTYAKSLWSIFEFDKKLYFTTRSEIITVNYRILNENPSISEIFYSKDYYLKYIQAIQECVISSSSNMASLIRPVCGIIAVFLKSLNAADKKYSKKAIPKILDQLKKTSSLDELWQLSLRPFQPTFIAPGGIIDLIRIVLMFDNSCVDHILSIIPNPYLAHIQPDARVSAATFISTLSELSQTSRLAVQIGNEIQNEFENRSGDISRIIKPMVEEISRLLKLYNLDQNLQPAVYNISQAFDIYVKSVHNNDDLLKIIAEFTASNPEKNDERNDNYALLFAQIISEEIRYSSHNPEITTPDLYRSLKRIKMMNELRLMIQSHETSIQASENERRLIIEKSIQIKEDDIKELIVVITKLPLLSD